MITLVSCLLTSLPFQCMSSPLMLNFIENIPGVCGFVIVNFHVADDVTWFMSWVTFSLCVLPNNTWIAAHLLWALIRLKQVSTILKLPAALP